MGCDIHAHIEYYTEPSGSTNTYTHTFATDIDLGRNYTLFSLMAGVRGMCSPVCHPKGLPTNPPISYGVAFNYYAFVVEDLDSEEGLKQAAYKNFQKHVISRKQAEELTIKGVQYHNQEKTLIADPSYHTPSWLTLAEMLRVRQKYLLEAIEYESDMRGKRRRDAINLIDDCSPEELMGHNFGDIEYVSLNATIAAMMILERHTEYKSRLVFWFDS
jgi:hypothetical protein